MTPLDRLVADAAREPLAPRAELFGRLSGAPAYALRLGEASSDDGARVALKASQEVSLWAEPDAGVPGAVWVPVFTSPERVRAFVERRGLQAPEGREFQWLECSAAGLCALIEEIPCLAGAWLDGGPPAGVRLERPELRALAEGRAPPEAPVLYSLPTDALRLPEGLRCLLGREARSVPGVPGRPVLFPEAGEPSPEDFRRLVQIDVDDPSGPAWTPCRHLAAALAALAGGAGEEFDEALLRSLTAFEMYGEAEALCLRFADAPELGRRASAWATLAEVLLRVGRLDACIEACRRGAAEGRDRREFYLHQAQALAQKEELQAAREVARRGAERFPRDEAIRRFL